MQGTPSPFLCTAQYRTLAKLDNGFRYTSLGKSNPPSLHLKKLDEDKENCTLYVYNLKKGVTTRKLENIFEDFGPLKRVHKNDSDNGPFKSTTYAMITYFKRKDALTALKELKGTMLQEKTMKIKIAHNKGKVWLNKSEAEAKKPEKEMKDLQSDDTQSQLSFEIIHQSEEKVEIHETKEMLEEEGEFDIDKEEIEDDQDDDETQLKIIDDTRDYFDQNLCVVHPHDESFEEIEIHQPTTPTPGPINAWCPKCGDVFSS